MAVNKANRVVKFGKWANGSEFWKKFCIYTILLGMYLM